MRRPLLSLLLLIALLVVLAAPQSALAQTNTTENATDPATTTERTPTPVPPSPPTTTETQAQPPESTPAPPTPAPTAAPGTTQMPTSSTTGRTTVSSTTTTTTTQTFTTRAASMEPLPTGVLTGAAAERGNTFRIEPARNETTASILALLFEYAATQRPYVLPRRELPTTWNMTINATTEREGWSVYVNFYGAFTGASKTAADARKNAPTTGAPPTQAPKEEDKPAERQSDGEAAAAAARRIKSEEEHLSEGLARLVYAACNSQYARPPAFSNRILACTGIAMATTILPGEAQHKLPIPRSARDPTTSTGPSVIPNWALVLGVVAAAVLGWAMGMLIALAVCPKLPRVNLLDRVLQDEDEEEQDLSVVFREKMTALCPCCKRKGSGASSADGDKGATAGDAFPTFPAAPLATSATTAIVDSSLSSGSGRPPTPLTLTPPTRKKQARFADNPADRLGAVEMQRPFLAGGGGEL